RRRGLFSGRAARLDGPLLEGWSVYHAVVDPRSRLLHAAANHFVYGATAQRSPDLGRTWERAEALALPESSGLKLEASWHVEPAGETLWLGCDPGCLFRSEDDGGTWTTNEALLLHPTPDRGQ